MPGEDNDARSIKDRSRHERPCDLESAGVGSLYRSWRLPSSRRLRGRAVDRGLPFTTRDPGEPTVGGGTWK